MKAGAVLFLIAFSSLLPSHGSACEAHAKMAAKAELPDRSIYHLDSEWTDQKDRGAPLSALRGHPRLVAMVFTKCPTACPLIVQEIKNIRLQLSPADQAVLHVDLFSFDPAETKKSLNAFVDKYRLDDMWTIHRSSESAVAELAAALEMHYKALPNGDFVHANVVYLVDQNGVPISKNEGLSATEEFVKAVSLAMAKGR